MQKGQTNSLSDAIEIGYLNLKEAEFYKTSGGFTGLRINGEDYKRVALRRMLPVGMPGDYISVADHENKEIGVIRSVSELSDVQFGIVMAELNKRYYCPEIHEIKSVKDKLGYVYMELSIHGEDRTYMKNCAVKDVNKNIRMLNEDSLIIFDVDGNRFIVKSLKNLDNKSMKRLEPYLF